MVGLNHEMARELLWREYPTDQRGTCFRQFWDVRGLKMLDNRTSSQEPEDIPPINTWGMRLGLHGKDTGKLVLVLRGELLRRYPNTIIYAVEAVRSSGTNKRTLGTDEIYPVFRERFPRTLRSLGSS